MQSHQQNMLGFPQTNQRATHQRAAFKIERGQRLLTGQRLHVLFCIDLSL